MNRIGITVVRAFVVACLALAGTAAEAADKLQGMFGLDAHKETFTHGLAWVDAKGEVTVGFYTADLDAKDQARAMKGEGAVYGLFDKPNGTITFRLKSGASQATLDSVESCSIVFWGFEFGPFTWNGDRKGCGAVALSGAPKAGGVIHGKFKGQTESFFPQKDGHKPVYTWDIDFTATLLAKH